MRERYSLIAVFISSLTLCFVLCPQPAENRHSHTLSLQLVSCTPLPVLVAMVSFPIVAVAVMLDPSHSTESGCGVDVAITSTMGTAFPRALLMSAKKKRTTRKELEKWLAN